MPTESASGFARLASRWGEIPPSAGLPLSLKALWPARPRAFAQAAAAFLGVDNAQIECSGTACLVLVLATLQRLSARRKVIIPAYTCPLVLLAIRHCGLQAVLCDVRAGSFEFDEVALAAHCDADTLAVIPTHLAGRVADTTRVNLIARNCGALLIEDAAQAFGARVHGLSVGKDADFSFFSLAVGKGLSTFEGGIWFARDAALRTEILKTREQLLRGRPAFELLRCLQLIGYSALYRPLPLRLVYGLPLRRALRRNDVAEAIGDVFDEAIPLHHMSHWRQGVGSRGLQQLPAFQHALRQQAERRVPALRALPGLQVLDDKPGVQGSWPLIMLLMPTQAARDAALAELWPLRLGASRLFAEAIGDYAYLAAGGGTQTPNARDFAARTLSLSNSLWLDDAQFAQILAVLRKHLAASAQT
ncbi:DegT/DnrJ/EryC1/StrS family aminotransferase [Uliginosibacterium sediminicola]|uniref:DegT/DnrJ/EryC1/StrS family aminotransferase n=1 Tax=Uliginosibacterium sediminicola TaxID=2024550 RepID=A0ABU9Z2D3_9RHOO